MNGDWKINTVSFCRKGECNDTLKIFFTMAWIWLEVAVVNGSATDQSNVQCFGAMAVAHHWQQFCLIMPIKQVYLSGERGEHFLFSFLARGILWKRKRCGPVASHLAIVINQPLQFATHFYDSSTANALVFSSPAFQSCHLAIEQNFCQYSCVTHAFFSLIVISFLLCSWVAGWRW